MNKNAPFSSPDEAEAIATAAATWVLRQDRGLTAAEQDEFSAWLAVDPRHGVALAEQRWGWDEFDRLAGLQTTMGAPNPDLLAPKKRARRGVLLRWAWAPVTLAAAAAVTLMWNSFRVPAASGAARAAVATVPAATDFAALAALAAPCERRTLDDGSVVELNRGATIEVAFTKEQRRVRLLRGEASFTVAKDAARPFVVDAAGVAVRAIGTVFNVRLDHAAVEVLVTEGKVQVESPRAANATASTETKTPTPVAISQRAVISLAGGGAPQVDTLSAAELAARLAWQPRLLDFTDAPLAEIVAEFNRRNPVQLAIGDAALGAVRLSATFRSDNVEGFVRLMTSDFGMRADAGGEREIVLRRE